MCTGVIRVVDGKYPPLYLFGTSRALTSLSLELHALLAQNSRNGKTGGNPVKSWFIQLSWDFLVSTLRHPGKHMHIATLFRSPVNDVGDKFGSTPAGLGFRCRGARESRNDTKR